jgi:hypothetical protein
MHSSIHLYIATERHNSAIRDARRTPVPPPPPLDDPPASRGLVAILTRRLPRSHALRTVLHRL